ncbi:FHA domain-containing protein [Saccharopolyspora mangrovi]|uniref:FHA domain-containing protein n=1 Tax=Saccharopolyspora mangrovi TaxID=3082379 RepID=A0ABU6ABZ4_9PSEU|nr:FHA domain-containing protein [Saccharopolyspora sp. S2-29]MEB3369082.1 FHA domain-containing protein [Saccharopolyspora sp. S2-29]
MMDNGAAAAALCETARMEVPSMHADRPAVVPARAMVPEQRDSTEGMRLEVGRGSSAGTSFALGAGRTVIGRHRDSDIVVDDVTVSRHHAELVVRDGRYVLEDGGSLNGTYVNRTPVISAELSDGDEIWIGKMRLTFRTGVPTTQQDHDRPAAISLA